MEFEFNENKSATNRLKHGINFFEAQELWADPDLIEIPARISDEQRFMIVGKIKGKHWSGIITYRGDTIRIISIRRSRREEIEIYES